MLSETEKIFFITITTISIIGKISETISETSWQRHLRRLTKNRQIWYVACYYGMFPEGLKNCGAIFRTDGLVTHFQPALAKLTNLNRQHRNVHSFAKDRKVYLKKVYDSLERELQREGCGASDHK